MRRLLSNLWRSERASAAVELALLAPVLLTLTLGMVDAARYLMVLDKAHRVATSSGDLITRFDSLTRSNVNSVLAAVDQIAQPLDLTTAGGVIVTGVTRQDANGGRRVAWQVRMPETLTDASRIGVPNGAPTLPQDFDLRNGETAVFAEVFYSFEPYVFASNFLDTGERIVRLYEQAVYRPRLGTLNQIIEK